MEQNPEETKRIESVWDYPRPPRLERTDRHLTVTHGGILLADTRRAMRILETSHPPVYYIPPTDIAMGYFEPSPRRGSFCEFKGVATYWNLILPSEETPGTPQRPSVVGLAWSYAEPSRAYRALTGYLAFYASKVDVCTVDGEPVQPQPGDFYGGWITSHVCGPFKGAPGTMGW